MLTGDADQVSGYPSDGMAANVSKDTTVKELSKIGDIPLSVFRIQNINLLFGVVNSIDYGSTMFNLPTAFEVLETIDKLKEKKVS